MSYSFSASTEASAPTVLFIVRSIDNFVLPPLQDWVWPPTFDSYIKIKYFWIIFVGCNLVWIIVPTSICYCILKEMERDYKPQKQKKQ